MAASGEQTLAASQGARLRVLYDHQIFSSQPLGGVSRYFAELLKAWPSFGIEPIPGWSYTANRYLHEWDPVRFHDWWPSMRFKGKAHLTGLLNRSASTRALRGSDWDLFHPTYYHPYFLPLVGDRPFVLTIHDMTHELQPRGLSDLRVTPGRKALLAARATRILAVSENTRQDVIRLLGIPEDKVVTVPHGNSLRPGLVQPQSVGASGYWLYVGNRQEYKNWSRLVLALGLRKASSDHLVMVGGGALTDAERRFLDEAGLSGRYRQTSASEPELAGWYTGAQALVYPSLYEGFGMPLIEAMAWGCPVVASRASCLPEIGGEAALYFDPNSTDDLVRALAEVSNPLARRRLVEEGRIRQEPFTWERTAEATLEVYRGCL